jgi:cell wall-associated NlpC family hydrolase
MSWLRTPYHHMGAVKGAGVDCAMLLVRVFQDAGLVPQFDPRPYDMTWHLHRSEERYLGFIVQHADEVYRPEPGDIVVYKFGRAYAHGAIVIAWPEIIHAHMSAGNVELADGEKGWLFGRPRRYYRVREA